MEKDNGASRGIDTRLLAAVAAIAYGLGMWWLQNTWNAIKDEQHAREALVLSIMQTVSTKEEIKIITAARQIQLDAIIARIERNTDRLIAGEENDRNLRETVAKMEADHAALAAAVATLQRDESGERHSPSAFDGPRR